MKYIIVNKEKTEILSKEVYKTKEEAIFEIKNRIFLWENINKNHPRTKKWKESELISVSFEENYADLSMSYHQNITKSTITPQYKVLISYQDTINELKSKNYVN